MPQTGQAALKEIERQGTLTLGALTIAQSALQNQVAGGAIFPFQAIERYDAAVQTAIPHLRDLAAQQRAAAVTKEDIQKAAQFDNTIDQMAASSSEAIRQLAQLKAGIEGGLGQAFTGFFANGIDQAHGFLDAVRLLAIGVLDAIRQVTAQVAGAAASKALLKLISGGGGSDATGQAEQIGAAAAAGIAQSAPLSVAAVELTAAGASIGLAGGALATGGSVVFAAAIAMQAAADTLLIANSIGSVGVFADGGVVSGPGTSTSDSVPARLSVGEYVVRAAAVRQPGRLAMLQAINQGMHLPPVRSRGSMRGYAAGGLVEGGAALDAIAGVGGAASGGRGHLLVSLEEGLVAKHMDSPAGHKVIVRGVTQNRNAVSQGLGIKHR